MVFQVQPHTSVSQYTAPVFPFFSSIVIIWLSWVFAEASRALNHSSKLTFVEKDSCREENKNLNEKYKNMPFDEAWPKNRDTLRSDNPPPVIFSSRKLYTETNQIWFENINSIYLREEMRCWVRGGAAGFKHNRNLTPFQ